MPTTQHPIWREVSISDAEALCRAEGVANPSRDQLKATFNRLHKMRELKIHREATDPLTYGFRPSIWFICMAVQGLDWMIPANLRKADGSLIPGGAEFGERVRAAFGIETFWDVLNILGGNRASKTQYECYAAQASLYRFPNAKVQMYHTDSNTSREVHQSRMFEYLKPPDRITNRTDKAYIAYKQKTGFSDGSYILGNQAECLFRNYEQKGTKPEGTEPGDPLRNRCVGYCADELAPVGLINTLDFRLAQFNSCGILGFTPIEGYTTTVGRFVEGATPIRYGKAFLVPRDGKEPLPELQFVHEDCLDWFDFENGVQVETAKSLPASLVSKNKLTCMHEGREFAVSPRLMQSASRTDGVVSFFTDDNPFINPADVWKKICDKSEDRIFERYYGFTKRKQAGAFPLFDERVHSIAPELIPKAGTNYMISDPSKNRNTAQLWVRCTPEEIYVYREWPSQVEAIPGQGFVGPWALPSDDLKKLDGKKGPAQNNFGWGLCSHKQEIARVEGWECYKPNATRDEIKAWKENGPAKESIEMRLLDARFGNVKGVDEGGQLNLFDQFDEIGLTYYESESKSQFSISDGVILINDALEYNPDKPVDFFNRPTLRISTDCQNLLFAMKVYTGNDGQHGACKDFIDCLRMFFLKGVSYSSKKAEERGISGGGGCY